MAQNTTLASAGFVTGIINEIKQSTTLFTALAGLLLVVALLSRVGPTIDASEPPVLKPTIPIIGHIVDIIRHQGKFFKKKSLAAATLPMLNGRMYAIWEPSLIQAMFRNKNLSFLPFAIEFAKKELDLSDDMMRLVKETDMVANMFGSNHPSLSSQHLHRMNRNALEYISGKLDEQIPENGWRHVPNLYLWVRDIMTLATSKAMYGPGLVMEDIPGLLDDLWTFEAGLPLLLLDVCPSITTPAAFKARARVQRALSDYYGAKSDLHEDAAEVVRARAGVLRRCGVTDQEVGQFELALLHVATANTIPTLFWFVAHVFSRGELVAQLQKEIGDLVEHQEDDAVMIDITKFEDRCPLLVSCYRETLRFTAQGTNTRRVMEDAIISDGRSGTFLLKKGCDVQASAWSSQTLEQVWGKEAMTWRGDRFINVPPESERARRVAYHPFGGGRHLCPGRNFAMAENLGFVAALVMGSDVVPAAGEGAAWRLPEMKLGSLAEAAIKLVNSGDGFGVRIRRKARWEKTRWLYKC